MPKLIEFMGVRMKSATRAEILEVIASGETVRIATPNPEFILDAQSDPVFKAAIASMTHCAIDGSGLYFALRFLARQAVERVQGADLVAELFSRYARGEKRFVLLGSHDATEAVNEIRRQFPAIQVDAINAGRLPLHPEADQALLRHIENLKADILLVGFGAPRQETWIQSANEAPIQVMIGVGGTFGFYSTKKRAPSLVRTLHMEWLFRALTEKGHWKRSFRAAVIFPLNSLTWKVIGK
jgi:N-acetylglucosaminyldiphosphoundecaprenol N-acetyl-beta-D-mannosaminyltransferase